MTIPACEYCLNGREDDCDGLTDGADPQCQEAPYCILVASATDPDLTMAKGECGGAALSGPFDVIRGGLENLQFASGSVDLGSVECVGAGLDWDRLTEWSRPPNPACDEVGMAYYLAQNTGDPDFGLASGGEPRDLMAPDPACP